MPPFRRTYFPGECYRCPHDGRGRREMVRSFGSPVRRAGSRLVLLVARGLLFGSPVLCHASVHGAEQHFRRSRRR